jgi:hypothetical protein
MKQQSMMIGVLIILVCVELSGCTQTTNTMTPEKSRFVGTWKATTGTMTMQGNITLTINLTSDGTCTLLGKTGSWDLKNDTLVLSVLKYREAYHYMFSDNNNTLALTSTEIGPFDAIMYTSGTHTFTRQ